MVSGRTARNKQYRSAGRQVVVINVADGTGIISDRHITRKKSSPPERLNSWGFECDCLVQNCEGTLGRPHGDPWDRLPGHAVVIKVGHGIVAAGFFVKHSDIFGRYHVPIAKSFVVATVP